MKRIDSIDIMRGLVMILMCLDHTRDLLHLTSVTQQPTDLTTTTPLLFFTRWITHLCAPTFVFLSGASAYLSFTAKGDPAQSRRYLLTRGLWLIILDLTIVNFGVWFDIHFAVFLFDVLSAIGVGFIVLSFLLKVPAKMIASIGLGIICLHNLSPLVPLPESSFLKVFLMPLFGPGAMPLPGGATFVMGYPPVPWLGIMLVGFAAGRLFLQAEAQRKRMYLKIAAASLLLFVAVRFVNVYGDSVPWQVQGSGMFTFLSFINVTKYPPSLVFCLLTLGTMFLILFLVDGAANRLLRVARIFGKVPLFFFIAHWYVIHPLVFAMAYLQGFKSSDLRFGFSFGRPEGSGVGLPVIYIIWLSVLLVMYPVCKRYGEYKQLHKERKWLSYL
ncbi:MAG: DUF1624 domain-containing protein [Flavobacterium sp.]|nr:MAG: DUF1624 domain-containing protein [Flavobacterium sp.]